jgi:hypothetical protein
MEFSQQQTIASRQSPENFVLRGSTLAQNYFPFIFPMTESAQRRVEERPDYAVCRQCIWHLAYELALVSWSRYQPSYLLIIRRPIDIWSMTTCAAFQSISSLRKGKGTRCAKVNFMVLACLCAKIAHEAPLRNLVLVLGQPR